MVTLIIGADPVRIELHVVRGSDFAATLHSDSGDWPNSSVITLEVAEHVWTAQLAGPDATFNVDAALVNTVIAAGSRVARFWYTNGSTRILAGYGPVVVRG